VLDWFDRLNVRYKGAFAPLRLADLSLCVRAAGIPAVRGTLDGFPLMRPVADGMFGFAGRYGRGDELVRAFPRPSPMSTRFWQATWIVFGLRFNCFTIAGIKNG
jgi:hypothetical protein